MKTTKLKAILIIVFASTIFFTSCLKDSYNAVELPSSVGVTGFDYKTTKDVNVKVTTLNNSNQPIDGVHVKLYAQNPINPDGTLKADNENYLIITGTTNSVGQFDCHIAPATTVDSITVLVDRIGLPQLQTMKISSSDMNIVIGGISANNVSAKVRQKAVGLPVLPDPATSMVNGFYTLGTVDVNNKVYPWDNQGVPNYLLTPRDVISNTLMADLTATLPEYKSLLTTHPTFLDNSNDGSLKITKDAEVFLTFLHEGAGYLNTLAYYTYSTATPPATTTDVKNKIVIFPNSSYTNSGGGLTSGDKVQLLYLNPVTKQYSKIFPAGTTVAWFLYSNGWNGTTVKTVDNNMAFYSNYLFNPETEQTLRKHNITLYDAKRDLLIVSFEDMRRDKGSDNDFNDIVFYAVSNPVEAIDKSTYKELGSPVDTDGDGVPDASDDYPNDPSRSHNNYFPAKAVNGSLAFEDLWPYKGDYDFNDMVVDYNFNQITNAQNNVVEIDATLTLRAVGAHFKNAFAIQFNTTPDNIASVTGQIINTDIFKIAQNGTENNQEKAVIFAFDDAFSAISPNNYSSYINTIIGGIYFTPKIINLKINFKNPVSTSNLGGVPFNPFIVVNGERGKEVHLAGSTPTKLVDLSLFGKGQDNSNVATGKYYMSDKYLPWALNIPVLFKYPIEKEDITKAYLMFNKWAASNGTTNTDWYMDKSGYRDATKLY